MQLSSQSCPMETSNTVLSSSKRKVCFEFSESSSAEETDAWRCGEMIFVFTTLTLGPSASVMVVQYCTASDSKWL